MPIGSRSRHKLRIAYAALFVFVLAFTLYEELYLRRWLFHRHGISAVVAGSLPNFLAVMLFGLAILVVKLPETIYGTIRSISAVVIGLALYEIAQIWMPNRVFDWNDLVATLLGGIACWALVAVPRLIFGSR